MENKVVYDGQGTYKTNGPSKKLHEYNGTIKKSYKKVKN
jgi:hypothetical protein